MRQIGTLPKPVDPKLFTDYLLTLGIKTRVDDRPEGWGLWIYNEDHVERARAELQDFLKLPDDPRYSEAVEAAGAVRRKEQELDQQFRKNYREVSDLWSYPSLRRRPVTMALIAISVVVFVLLESPKQARVVEKTLRFSTTYVDSEGRERNSGVNNILQGEVWRLVTPIFMHFGILHILFNAWALSSFGTLIEVRKGSLRLALLVLIAAVLSNIGQYLYMERVDPGEPQLFGGISGVICALFGYVWMKGHYEPEDGMILHPNSVTFVLLWLALCMTGAIENIANAAHVVGLIVGVAFGVLRY